MMVQVFSDWVNKIDEFITKSQLLTAYVTGNKEAFAAIVMAQHPELQPATPAQQAISARNRIEALKAQEGSILGQIMGAGGGHGSAGAYQGGFAGFHAKVQEAAWQQNQLTVLRSQLAATQQMIALLTVIAGGAKLPEKSVVAASMLMLPQTF